MKGCFFTISLLLTISILYAQESKRFLRYNEKYKGHEVVNTVSENRLKISYGENDSLTIRATTVEQKMYLRADAAKYAKGVIYTSSNRTLENIEAYTLVYNGKKTKKKEIEEFVSKKEFSSSVFHDVSSSVNFFSPSLGKGVESVLDYTIDFKVSQLLGPFYLKDFHPTELRIIEVEVEHGIDVEFIYRNISEEEFKPTITDGKKSKIYRWELKDLSVIEYSSGSPSITYYTPHIIPRITSYDLNGTKVKHLGNVKDLYSWYYSLLEKVDKTPSDEIKNLVDLLASKKRKIRCLRKRYARVYSRQCQQRLRKKVWRL